MAQRHARRQRTRPTDHDVLVGLLSHRHVVRSYIYRRVANPHAVDDLVSDVYIVAWRRLSEVPSEPERAIRWLCAVGRNLLRNHIRGEARRSRLVERAAQDATSPWSQEVGADRFTGIDSVAARDSWNSLSEDDRHMLARALAGVPHGKIAAELGIRGGAVAMRLLRARAHLVAVHD